MANEPWYVAERAVELAKVALTRQKKVVVEQRPHADRGVDLFVNLERGRIFGVEVKGTMEAGRFMTAAGELKKSAIGQLIKSVSEHPFPVLLMLFEVPSNRGFAGWLVAPNLSPQRHKLLRPVRIGLKPIEEDLIDDVFVDVNRWYDAMKEPKYA